MQFFFQWLNFPTRGRRERNSKTNTKYLRKILFGDLGRSFNFLSTLTGNFKTNTVVDTTRRTLSFLPSFLFFCSFSFSFLFFRTLGPFSREKRIVTNESGFVFVKILAQPSQSSALKTRSPLRRRNRNNTRD